jgi:hypothetical protein
MVKNVKGCPIDLCLPSRLNRSPVPYPASECVSPPHPLPRQRVALPQGPSGGRHLACGVGGWRDPITVERLDRYSGTMFRNPFTVLSQSTNT